MKCAIFGHARSGTTTLQECVGQHPDLKLIGEPFNKFRGVWGKEYLPLINSGPDESFDKVFQELEQDCSGFKHLIGQLPLEQVDNLLKHLPKIIWIERKNLLQASVSKQICLQANHWRRNRDAIKKCKYITIPPEAVLKTINWWQRLVIGVKAKIIEQEIPIFELKYEEMYASTKSLSKKVEAVQDIFKFLGLSKVSQTKQRDRIKQLLDPDYSKLNNFDTYRLIPNIDEIAALGNDDIGYLFTEI